MTLDPALCLPLSALMAFLSFHFSSPLPASLPLSLPSLFWIFPGVSLWVSVSFCFSTCLALPALPWCSLGAQRLGFLPPCRSPAWGRFRRQKARLRAAPGAPRPWVSALTVSCWYIGVSTEGSFLVWAPGSGGGRVTLPSQQVSSLLCCWPPEWHLAQS